MVDLWEVGFLKQERDKLLEEVNSLRLQNLEYKVDLQDCMIRNSELARRVRHLESRVSGLVNCLEEINDSEDHFEYW